MKNLQRTTLGLLAVFAIFLIILGIQALLRQGDADVIQLTVQTGGQVKYIPLESMTYNSLSIDAQTFSGASEIVYTVFFMILIVCAGHLYYKVACRQYLKNLKTYRTAFKSSKKEKRNE